MSQAEHTFEKFIVTPFNRFAYLVAQEICKSPGSYNPLYLYGPAGVGKTHLLRAIGEVYQNQHKTGIYLSANQFVEEMINAIKTGANVEFKDKYCQVDILLIDRLQYISGKEATQEELYSIIEKRLSDNKQTVFAGNAAPAQLDLEQGLRSFVARGLCVEVPTQGVEETAQIIFQKLKELGIDLPLGTCKYIALNIPSKVCQIEGEINKILALSKLL